MLLGAPVAVCEAQITGLAAQPAAASAPEPILAPGPGNEGAAHTANAYGEAAKHSSPQVSSASHGAPAAQATSLAEALEPETPSGGVSANPPTAMVSPEASTQRVDNWGLVGVGLDEDSPTHQPGLPTVQSVDVSTRYKLAIDIYGNVWASGYNGEGALGVGSTRGYPGPVIVSNISNVIQTATGDGWSMALEENGTVWSWGYGNGGLTLGTGARSQLSPVQITFPSNAGPIVDIAAAGTHGLALAANGTVWAWGGNNTGALGTGTTLASDTPVQVTSLTGQVLELQAGCTTSAALLTNGTVATWGSDDAGQLGLGKGEATSSPTVVPDLSGVTQISMGGNTPDDGDVIAMTSSGVVIWGYGKEGEIGNGTNNNAYTPQPVAGLPPNIVAVSAGGLQLMAVDSDGNVYAWGGNSDGQLGNGTTTSQSVPVKLSISGVTAVSAGPLASAAISDG